MDLTIRMKSLQLSITIVLRKGSDQLCVSLSDVHSQAPLLLTAVWLASYTFSDMVLQWLTVVIIVLCIHFAIWITNVIRKR